jgi:peroxiredoxin
MTALQDQLDEITSNTRNLVQPERMAVSERAVADLFASGIEEKILPVGAIAPEFTLPDATGRPVRSADLLALGPLVLNFFRGRWCAYCVTELEAWRDLYPRLREAGALLAAIGPQTSRQSDFMVGQHSLPFPVLTDLGCALADQFGLAYTIPIPPRLLPLHPRQHPLRQWRPKLASDPARHLRPRPRPPRALRPRLRRLPRPPRA